jgi:hypothetical protein
MLPDPRSCCVGDIVCTYVQEMISEHMMQDIKKC